jgi:hypothetical protein
VWVEADHLSRESYQNTSKGFIVPEVNSDLEQVRGSSSVKRTIIIIIMMSAYEVIAVKLVMLYFRDSCFQNMTLL